MGSPSKYAGITDSYQAIIDIDKRLDALELWNIKDIVNRLGTIEAASAPTNASEALRDRVGALHRQLAHDTERLAKALHRTDEDRSFSELCNIAARNYREMCKQADRAVKAEEARDEALKLSRQACDSCISQRRDVEAERDALLIQLESATLRVGELVSGNTEWIGDLLDEAKRRDVQAREDGEWLVVLRHDRFGSFNSDEIARILAIARRLRGEADLPF